MDNTTSTSSWAAPSSTTASGNHNSRPTTAASSSSSSSYQVLGLRNGSHATTTTTTANWRMGYDSNNNSSSCTSNESEAAAATRSKSLQTFCLDKATSQPPARISHNEPAAVVDIAELAKNIGNELRGAFIVLPQKSIFFDPVDLEGDDVSTNSEDCVYAYRGDHVEGGEEMQREMAVEGDALAVDIDDDDETDFLEMDFDPEPNSEQENFQRRAENGYSRRSEASLGDDVDGVDDMVEREEALNEWRDRHDPAGSSRSPRKEAATVTVKEHCTDDDNINSGRPIGGAESLIVKDIIVPENKFNGGSGDLDAEKERETETNACITTAESTNNRVTGTIPKLKIQPVIVQAIDPPQINTITLPQVPAVPSTSNSIDTKKGAPEVLSTCLECTDQEFVTKSQENPSAASSHCKTHCKKVKNCDPETSSSLSSPTKFVHHQSQQIQVYPNSLDDEEHIYSALVMLGVKLHRDRLRQQIESNRLALEQTKTIADYLIEYTKAHCDPRRFIKMIEDSCSEEVFRELEFDFQQITSELQLLELNGDELLSRWSPEQSLRELSRIGNARFHAANVLGKVANLIRTSLKQKCREIDKVTVVTVPTFYRPGLLMISKRGQPILEHQTTLY